MILRKLTATYGKLDHETLELTDGLNILTAPNEWGKSTWSSFLLAMFYGVDASERSSAKTGRIAEKDKYLPWSGKAMSGSVELTWKGRNITIQRTTKGRVRLGVFEAFDTDTGEKLPQITAENCGAMLLGAERSVFVRSAFIGQSAIAVTKDAELNKRLHSLASAGEETVSCIDTQDRLNKWKNHVRHNRTGLLPEAEASLASVSEKLNAIRAQREDALDCADRKLRLEERERELVRICDSLRAAELNKRRAQMDAAAQELADARQAADEARKAAAALPGEAELLELDDRFDRLAADRAALHRVDLPITPPEPHCSPVFSGSSPEDARRRARTDADAVRALQKPMEKMRFPIVPLCLLLCGAVLALVWNAAVGLAVCGAAAVLLAVQLILRGTMKRAWQARQDEAGQILRNYSAADADGILAAAVRYGEALRQHKKEVEEIHERWRERNEELSRLTKEEKVLLGILSAFSPESTSPIEAKQAIRRAQQQLREAEKAEAKAAAAERRLRDLREICGEVETTELPEEDFSDRCTPEEAKRELDRVRAELAKLAAELAANTARVESYGDPDELTAEREALAERIELLEKRNDALLLAQETLAEADRRMQARISPQLNKLAGEYLARMTDERYEKLLLDQNFALTAKAADSDAARPLAALSGGTAEQVYFALRLAICALALESDTPIVLDDAFVFFDDKRLAQALKLLKEEAEHRQILLFTCQGREQTLAEK